MQTQLLTNRPHWALEKVLVVARSAQQVGTLAAAQEGAEEPSGAPREGEAQDPELELKAGAVAAARAKLPGREFSLASEVGVVAGEHMMEVMSWGDAAATLGIGVGEREGSDADVHPRIVVAPVCRQRGSSEVTSSRLAKRECLLG
jgi:hypothetical protein